MVSNTCALPGRSGGRCEGPNPVAHGNRCPRHQDDSRSDAPRAMSAGVCLKAPRNPGRPAWSRPAPRERAREKPSTTAFQDGNSLTLGAQFPTLPTGSTTAMFPGLFKARTAPRFSLLTQRFARANSRRQHS